MSEDKLGLLVSLFAVWWSMLRKPSSSSEDQRRDHQEVLRRGTGQSYRKW